MIDEEILRNLFKKGNGILQVPLGFQIPLLGLDNEAIKSLIGKTGLDIACGNGSLVEELRKKGVLFEGIDPKAPEKPYFIAQKITSVYPLTGSIPREDNSYDIVTAFQCCDFNRGFTRGGELRTAIETAGNRRQDWHTARYKHAQSTLYEAIRVVKPGRKVVVYPALVRLGETIGLLLSMQGIDFYTEPVDNDVAKEYLKTESPIPLRDLGGEEYARELGLLERTVLVKKK